MLLLGYQFSPRIADVAARGSGASTRRRITACSTSWRPTGSTCGSSPSTGTTCCARTADCRSPEPYQRPHPVVAHPVMPDFLHATGGPCTVLGQASRMKLALSRLREQHGIDPPSATLPLLPAVDHDLIVEGLAATADVDHARMKFRPWCFSWTKGCQWCGESRSRSGRLFWNVTGLRPNIYRTNSDLPVDSKFRHSAMRLI